MCYNLYKVKSVNPVSPVFTYVPCGHCKECLEGQKASWSIRLALEFNYLQKLKWNVCFCTLTYSDENLPYVPESCFRGNFSDVPCFNRNQVRAYIVTLRREIHRRYGAKSLRYIVCSEFGSYTRRPHYHAMFAVPPEVPIKDFYELVKHFWTYGFIFPRYFEGGLDSKGYNHSQFVVAGTSTFASAYAAKYVCKDMAYYGVIKEYEINLKHRDFKNCDCFHIQSRSLGLAWLRSLSQDELLDIVKNGVSFPADSVRHQLPIYFKNKIFFNPNYIVERRVFEGEFGTKLVNLPVIMAQSDEDLEKQGYRVEYKRLVRRECSDFFVHHYEDIYRKKVDFWKSFFERFYSKDYFLAHGLDDETSSNVVDIFGKMSSGLASEFIARWYVSYFGLSRKHCYSIDFSLQWYLRYGLPKISLAPALKSCGLVGEIEFDLMHEICHFCLSVCGWIHSEYTDLDKLTQYIKDKLTSEV